MIPGISVIIVHFNTPLVLEKCVFSVRKQNVNCEIIVVDNNSAEKPLPETMNYENVKVIYNKLNFGFGKANNIGVKEAKGEYLFFINSDVIINEDLISETCKIIGTITKPVLITNKVLNEDSTPQVIAGKNPSIIREYFSWTLNKIAYIKLPYLNDNWYKTWEYNEITKVQRISGCFMATRKSDFDRIGGFDEKFFMYYEDADLCRRYIKNGGVVLYNPKGTITHLKGVSTNTSNREFIINEEFKSSNYYLTKYNSLISVKLLFIFIRLTWVMEIILLFILRYILLNKALKVNQKYETLSLFLKLKTN